MARIRTIKPEFFTDEELGQLSPAIRLLFIALWTEADKAGRLKDRPKTLKARCVPFDHMDIDKALGTLADGKFIVRYEAEGEAYIQIRTWNEHQRPHHTERESVIPERVNGYLTVKEPLLNGVNDSVNTPFPSLPVLEVSKNKPSPLNLPFQDSPDFQQAWITWVAHRKQIKKPLTAEQTKAQLEEFSEWGVGRSVAAIKYTVKKGWQGLREPEVEPNGSQPKHNRLKAAMDEMRDKDADRK
jgi:hypothetical protein